MNDREHRKNPCKSDDSYGTLQKQAHTALFEVTILKEID
jgi:hypothetical protein